MFIVRLSFAELFIYEYTYVQRVFITLDADKIIPLKIHRYTFFRLHAQGVYSTCLVQNKKKKQNKRSIYAAAYKNPSLLTQPMRAHRRTRNPPYIITVAKI